MGRGRMNPHVLVVDDDAENCRALSELLEAEGFAVTSFASGDAAWSAIRNQAVHPDAIVADVRMPGLDGVALLRAVKGRSPALPLILVSAFPDETVWSEAIQAGAVDVFPKPIRGRALVDALTGAIGSNPGRHSP